MASSVQTEVLRGFKLSAVRWKIRCQWLPSLRTKPSPEQRKLVKEGLSKGPATRPREISLHRAWSTIFGRKKAEDKLGARKGCLGPVPWAVSHWMKPLVLQAVA